MRECTCIDGFESWSLSSTLAALERMGLQAFESGCGPKGHLFSYMEGRKDIAELREILAASPVKLVCVSGFSDFAVNNARWEQEKEHVARQIRFTREIGVDLLRIFVSFIPGEYVTEEVWQRVLRNVRQVTPLADDLGIRLALENHFGITAKAEDLLRVVENVDSPMFGVNLDPANFVPTGEDPVRATETLLPFIIHTHIKDCVRVEGGPYFGYDFAELGVGLMSYREILYVLKKGGYAGYLSLEYERVDDMERGTEVGLRNLRAMLSGL